MTRVHICDNFAPQKKLSIREPIAYHRKSFLGIIFLLFSTFLSFGQPLGWSHSKKIVLFDYSGLNTVDYQFKFSFNSASLIAAGELNPDLSDLRFSSDCAGLTNLHYWIESGVNTYNTRVWVKIPLLAASQVTNIYMHYGNLLAISESNVVGTFQGPFSATDSISPATTSTNSLGGQRGFTFSPNEDMLLYALGKNDFNLGLQPVSLFDAQSQSLLCTNGVLGLPGLYNYNSTIQPMWLSSGANYTLVTNQNALSNTSFLSNNQLTSQISFVSTNSCDVCGSGDYPTVIGSGNIQGVPDILFFTKHSVSPAPFYQMADNDTLDINLSADVAICLGDSVSLSAMIVSGLPILTTWTSAGISINDVPEILVSPSVSTTYHFTAIDECANFVEDSIRVTVNALPNLTIVSSTPNSCSGDFVDLSVSGAESYVWSTGATLANIQVSPVSTYNYSVVGIDSNGCSNQTNYTQIVSFPGVRSQIIDICPNTSFEFNGHSYTENGVYLDTISMNTGCDSIIITGINVQEALEPTIELVGNDLQVNVSADSYQWIDCTNENPIAGEFNNVFSPNLTGNYAVQTTFNGCVETSACYFVDVLSISQYDLSEKLQFSNPIIGSTFFFSDQNREVFVIDLTGKCVKKFYLEAEKLTEITFDQLSIGSYFLHTSGLVKRIEIR